MFNENSTFWDDCFLKHFTLGSNSKIMFKLNSTYKCAFYVEQKSFLKNVTWLSKI